MIATTAFIANTDYGWFSPFRHRAEPTHEVNFWQPLLHGFMAIPTTARFYVRLSAPNKAIAGCVFLARHEGKMDRAIPLPQAAADRPNPELLEQHRTKVTWR